MQFLRKIWAFPGVRLAFITFLATRIALSAWVMIVRQVYDQPLPPHPVLRPYVGVQVSDSQVLEPWQRWDTLHYQAIAERGYAAFVGALFTPPLFPGLMRVLAPLLGGDTLLAGIIVGNAAYLLGLIAFYHYALHESKDLETSRRSLIYLALFPAAFFFLAAYTESLFLLTASIALLMTHKKRWILAGLAGGLAAATRLTGAVLLIPLAYAALVEPRKLRPWLAPLGTAVGAAVLPLYTWLVLNQPPWTPILVQSNRFHGGFSFPGANVLATIQRIGAGLAYPADYWDLAFMLLFVALAVPVWRRLSRVSAVFYLSFLGLYLVREAGVQPLIGTPRYVLIMLPAFIVLGSMGRNPWVNRLILYPSLALLLFMAGQFAIWGWVG